MPKVLQARPNACATVLGPETPARKNGAEFTAGDEFAERRIDFPLERSVAFVDGDAVSDPAEGRTAQLQFGLGAA